MNSLIRGGSLCLLTVLMLPVAAHASLRLTGGSPERRLDGTIARGGGGRGGGGGNFRSGGGGGGLRSGGGSRGQTGFQGAASGLNRGDRRPTGGWGSSIQAPQARPSINRPTSARDINRDAARMPQRNGGGNFNRDGNALTRPAGGRELSRNGLTLNDSNRNINRDFNRNINSNRTFNRDINRDINRNWTRNVNIGDVNLHPGWARPGWGVARPWNWGWYGGWSNPPWGWWGARAAVWGIGTLATAAVINDAVNTAIDSQTSYIVVPNSSYQLLYGSVAPSGDASVSFAVTADGNTYQLSADCQAGTINGQAPANAAEAELLNAACQVAFGST